MNEKMTLIAILVAAACTLLMRALPFTLLGRKREVPKKIRYLGRILPSAIMAVLVIYCVRDIATDFSGKGIREIIAASYLKILNFLCTFPIKCNIMMQASKWCMV